MNPLFLALAIAAGAAIAAQAAVNSQLAAGLGGQPIAAAFVSFTVGTLALFLIAAASGSLSSIGQLPGQPAWRMLGGLLGAGAIFCTVMLAPRLGLAVVLSLVIAGQLLASVVIDHFGLLGAAVRPATAARLIGSGLMTVGVIIALFGDRLARTAIAS
ncbi:DMT family transporter [Sphingomonas sp. CLY1604]|uniref:DMT family transporter n=1 Tax=Sphingomonas sp. CLY1604 TaxID=3457786 RepID=UPI003FD77490